MHPRSLLVMVLVGILFLSFLLVPEALGETTALRAGGATMGPSGGVMGLQTGPDDAVGLRYWQDAGDGGGDPGTYTLRVTTCYTSGSGTVSFCQVNTLTV